QAMAQLIGGVLQAEGEQQEQHPDLGHEPDELGADVERRDAPFADRQPGQQIEGDGRDPEAAGQSGQGGEDERHGPDLDERPGGVGPGGSEHGQDASKARSWASPSVVPTATTTSPASKPWSGSE